MHFSDLSTYFQKLESTSSRLTITEILAELYKKLTPEEACQVSYLLQGRVAPVFEAVEFGIADKMLFRAIAIASGETPEKVIQTFKKLGDLGSTAEELKKHKKSSPLNISEVFEDLHKVATTGGKGSQEQKLAMLSGLIAQANSLSARYIARIPLGKLRLGFSDMTILDALSWMLDGTKTHRKTIEKAYNVRPDLGYIGQTIKEKGLKGLAHVTPAPGTPILMARANRLTSSEEIIEKLGESAIEFKYDGLRLQVHKKGRQVWMFSRNLENVTVMFPDIQEAVLNQIAADQVIFEGEIVAYNPKTGVSVPFQETMQRKRKYDIDAKALEIPVKLYAFELLLVNSSQYLYEPYRKRKEKLKALIYSGKTIVYAQEKLVKTTEDVEEMFQQSITEHFEGIIAKKLDGVYEAGVRGWNWIKYKKAMNSKLSDTVDALVMGFTKGEGKRTSFGVGQFLAGVYDPKNDQFVTLTKVGTGLTDDQFKEFITRSKKYIVKDQPKNYSIDKLLEPDIWMKPGMVVELGSDEITRSQVHTAGRVMQTSKSGNAQEVKTAGFALRFPRLVKFRDDKAPTDATTVKEVADLFKKQK